MDQLFPGQPIGMETNMKHISEFQNEAIRALLYAERGVTEQQARAKLGLPANSYSLWQWICRIRKLIDHRKFLANREPLKADLPLNLAPYGKIPAVLKSVLRTQPEGLQWPIVVGPKGAEVIFQGGSAMLNRSLFLAEKGQAAEAGQTEVPSFVLQAEDTALHAFDFDENGRVIPANSATPQELGQVIIRSALWRTSIPVEKWPQTRTGREVTRRLADGAVPTVLVQKRRYRTQAVVQLRPGPNDPRVTKAREEIARLEALLKKVQVKLDQARSEGAAYGKASAETA